LKRKFEIEEEEKPHTRSLTATLTVIAGGVGDYRRWRRFWWCVATATNETCREDERKVFRRWWIIEM